MTVVQIARSYLGTRSSSPLVMKWLGNVGVKVLAAWCAAASISWHIEADPGTRVPRTARVSRFWAQTRGNSFLFQTFTAEDVAWGIATPQPGDYAIFAHNPEAQDFNGHVDTVTEPIDRRSFRSIGGNTTCQAKAGTPEQERMGGCVAEKVRHAGVRGFLLVGFVRERPRA